MLTFEILLIQNFSCFGAYLFSKHAYFRKGAYYRATTVVFFLDENRLIDRLNEFCSNDFRLVGKYDESFQLCFIVILTLLKEIKIL